MFTTRRFTFLLLATALLGQQLQAQTATFDRGASANRAATRVEGKPPIQPKLRDFDFATPTRDQLFRVQSEQALQARLIQELPNVKKVEFPMGARLRELPAEGVQPFAIQVVSPVTGAFCYRPLYFEDKRTERFGRYVPFVQPVFSAGRFYGGVLSLPLRMLMQPPWTFECDNR